MGMKARRPAFEAAQSCGQAASIGELFDPTDKEFAEFADNWWYHGGTAHLEALDLAPSDSDEDLFKREFLRIIKSRLGEESTTLDRKTRKLRYPRFGAGSNKYQPIYTLADHGARSIDLECSEGIRNEFLLNLARIRIARYIDPPVKFFGSKFNGVELHDFLAGRHLVVSTRVKQVLQRECRHPRFEYFPAHIFDHRRKELSTDYWLVNPPRHPCVDVRASGGKMDDGLLILNTRLAFDEKKLVNAPRLLRPREHPQTVLASESLLNVLFDAGLSNLRGPWNT